MRPFREARRRRGGTPFCSFVLTIWIESAVSRRQIQIGPELNHHANLILSYDDAKSLEPDLNVTLESFGFCQRAMLQARVVPMRSYGNLSERDAVEWDGLGCTNHFCDAKSLWRRCSWKAYGRELVNRFNKDVNNVCDRRVGAEDGPHAFVTVLTSIPRIPTDLQCAEDGPSAATKGMLNRCLHMLETLLAIGENARTPRVGHIHVRLPRPLS